MAFQFRRGTDAERQSITPKPGEPLYVTDTGQVYVGDGTTQGGNLVTTSVSDDDSPSLSGNLNLNGNDITGTGDIDITGSIHATGTITADGNITLGDGSEDNIIVGGVISSSLVPSVDGKYDLGDNLSSWRNGFFEGLNVDGEIVSETININNLISQDSSLVYSSESDTLSASTIIGDVIGSVFGEDSQLLIDTTDSSLNTSILKIRDTDIIVQNNTDGINIITNQGISVRANDIDGSPSSNLLILESAVTDNNGLSSPNPGDNIGGFGASIYSESIDTYEAKSLIITRLDTAGSGSNMDFVVADSTGELKAALTLRSSGIAESNIFKTGSYADETERDTAIPNPEQGMIIFLSGHNDSSGFPKFQGYDGTAWRDFN